MRRALPHSGVAFNEPRAMRNSLAWCALNTHALPERVMKPLFLASFAVMAVASAHASPAAPPAADGASTCDSGRVMSRVAYTLPLGPQCCDGQLRCTQLLSTTILPRSARDAHL
jgi:hypothetical protein